ncbi:MAG: VPLPA-CTERM sorting domain-containing protein [Pseudomonadota bacterium]
MAFTKTITAAVVAAGLCVAGAAAQAATLSGIFEVRVVNYTFGSNQNSSVAVANQSNFDTRFNAGTDGVNRDTFTYTGALDFFVDNIPADLDLESISDFLASATGGSVSGLDSTVGDLRLSAPTFRTTTLFEFTEVYSNAFDTRVTHDDGFSIYDDGNALLSFANPTGIRTTPKSGTVNFTGGEFKLVYAAANGNPSKLLVEGDGVPAVPLPAGFLLMGTALAGFGAVKRRKARG